MIAEDTVWNALESVTDPEIPVINIVELGIVQQVDVRAGSVRVALTPTFAGCPALYVMKEDVRAAVAGLGIHKENITVEVRLDPPWTSERISEEGRRKLKAIGLAPPERIPEQGGVIAVENISIVDGVACPYCDSNKTVLESAFGPTMCRSLYYCHSCKQPFEKFKAL